LDMKPQQVKIFTLGRFSIVRAGGPVRFNGKAQKKPLEMLKVLVALGGLEVKKEVLTDILWPDSDGDHASWAFNTTLYRLRKILGSKKALALREGRLTLDPKSCWVDICEFERGFSEADGALKEGDYEMALGLIEEAVSLYKGPFLAGETDRPWSISARERLRSKFIRYLGWLGSYCEECGDLGKALEHYKKGIETNNLAEDFYQCMMLCYKKLGRRAEALDVYKRLKKTLSETLDVEPSPRSSEIFKNL